jgi:hypothetical protein
MFLLKQIIKFMNSWKEPKNSDKYYWTSHAKMKMKQYGLSAQRVVRVIRRPVRIEEGVSNNTIAVVQPQSTKKGQDGKKTWSSEIWVMYQIKEKKQQFKNDKVMDEKMLAFLSGINNQKQIYIISVWRYPGKTAPGECLPDKILDEIAEIA